ncbi:MAG: thiamine pyrophosphate-dependent dehydrogenase E1 component subunit alpha [Microbacteriaceae bacterium]|nr:thiamine pyrophosphate-dependent dehydrogenase E1 component subunit alpha [Microbacteriaceae bacterium]MCL2794152.1 thiamine pyrophosphate-dependent dehydrogenase E1 component subunit alpha [Microbacteriaceae bacterium]
MTDSDVFVGSAARAPIRLLDESGSPVVGEQAAGFGMPSAELLLKMYRQMVLVRRFDVQVTTLTRQGRLATYAPALGQEACEIAGVEALAPQDWLFPSHRDTVAMLARGIPPQGALAFFRGEWHSDFDPKQYRVAPLTVPLATHLLHAVGLATAAKLKGDPVVSLGFLGDGATSEGDAHEAFNFATTWQSPTVFVIQNNQYAISVPLARQSHLAHFVDRAAGYGMPGYLVDGNDAAAMYAVISSAVERAREGGGPTLIEGVTYRVEAHTNSDDPTRYRTAAEVDAWRARDPLTRLERYLRAAGELDDELAERFALEAEDLAARTRELMNTEPVLDPLELFDHVYAAERPAMAEQRALLERELTDTQAGAQR